MEKYCKFIIRNLPIFNFTSYFNASSETIRIGRLNNCEVQIEDSLLSKYQATIRFYEEKGWILEDGFESKLSTNGTW